MLRIVEWTARIALLISLAILIHLYVSEPELRALVNRQVLGVLHGIR